MMSVTVTMLDLNFFLKYTLSIVVVKICFIFVHPLQYTSVSILFGIPLKFCIS